MNCRDFERIWNERIDTNSSPLSDLGGGTRRRSELALIEHATGCPECRRKAAGYHALNQSISAWGPPPAPPADLADRILAAARAEQDSARETAYTRRPGRRLIRALAAAASIMAIIAVGLMTRMSIDRTRDRDRMVAVMPGDSPSPSSDRFEARKLNDALASATEASWDLARSASEPAARLSRQFLDAATESGPSSYKNPRAPFQFRHWTRSRPILPPRWRRFSRLAVGAPKRNRGYASMFLVVPAGL